MNAISPKIEPRHLDRRAVVYVRQSTPRQVLTNQESTRRQYQLAERARQLGWPAPQIEIIDEDLGLSGADSQARTGFRCWRSMRANGALRSPSSGAAA